jgi:hypothetical protein
MPAFGIDKCLYKNDRFPLKGECRNLPLLEFAKSKILEKFCVGRGFWDL